MRSSNQGLIPQSEREQATSHRSSDQDLNYHSFSEVTEESSRVNYDFRGFSTSINDMFTDADHERTDCCAMACCGVLQGDVDRYLVTGVKPPSCFKRFWVHIVFPLWIFLLAMFCAVRLRDPWLNQMFSTGLVFLLLGYFVVQCYKGAYKRRGVRDDMLWRKSHLLRSGDLRQRSEEDFDDVSNSTEVPAYYLGQTRSDMKNAHGLCGCYVVDQSANQRLDEEKTSICTHFFNCFTKACCGVMCGMQLQLCGICGTAQEARELKELVEAGQRRIDYMTMQPYLEYYPAIYNERNNEEERSSWWNRLYQLSWWNRLSQLSKGVVKMSLGSCMLLFVWSILSERLHTKFGPKNFLVFCATLFQAFFLLSIVYWKHTKDISLDALIKFFACGFCLSTSLAVFYEGVVGLSLRFIMSLLMAIFGIDVVEGNGYSLENPGFGNLWNAMQENGGGTSSYRDYLKVFGKDHPIFYSIYLFFTAFILAAMIEELCKYFGYRMVEHPDFLSKQHLEEAADFQVVEDEEAEEVQEQDFSQQDRSLQSRGAAITVSMVAVSLGFACCENLVYIFVYGEASVAFEVIVLLSRSLFPVHPIAAALQSIRVCERDLEKKDKIKIGSVILPGVIFHGLYDFLIMWIDFMAHKDANYITDDDEAVGSIDNSDAIAFGVSVSVVLAGLWYYFRESRAQRKRFEGIDRETSVDQSSLL